MEKKNKKVSGCLIIFIVLIASLGGILFMGYLGSESDKKEMEVLVDKHSKVKWDELNTEQKEKLLDDFIRYHGIQCINDKKSMNNLAGSIVVESVKYPNTIKSNDESINLLYPTINVSSEIKDIDKGIIRFYGNFTAENKLSMPVKGHIEFNIKYNAGSDGYELINFNVD